MKPKIAAKKNLAKSTPTEEPVTGSGQTTKVLAIINEHSALMSVLSYLRKRDYQVKIAHSLMDGIRELTNTKTDILLISWSLKNTDIKKVHSVITQKFKAICYILGEDESTKSAAAMLSSGLPNTILYPVSSVTLYNRIELALGRSNTKSGGAAKKKLKSRDKMIVGGVEYKRPKKNEISIETVWNVRVNSPNPANQIWETVVYKGGKPLYYYYKGDKAPDKWLVSTDETAINDRSYVFASETPATGDILSSFSDYSESTVFESESADTEDFEEIEFDTFTPPDKEEKPKTSSASFKEMKAKDDAPSASFKEMKAKDDPSPISNKEIKTKLEKVAPVEVQKPTVIAPAAKPGPQSTESVSAPVVKVEKEQLATSSTKAESTKASQTLLEKSVNAAIALAMKSEVQSFEAPILIDSVSNLTVSVIKSSRFKGYLVSGQASDVSNPRFMKKVFDNLGKEMEKQNEALSTLCGVLELKLDSVPFKKWTKDKADFVIQSQIGNEEILFAFVPVDDLPQNFIDEDLVPVPIERFEEDKILYFDIFIHMQMNQKHILYLKNGAIFTKISRDRLVAYNTKVLYVKKADENLFFAYSARNVFEKDAINRSVPLPVPEIKKIA